MLPHAPLLLRAVSGAPDPGFKSREAAVALLVERAETIFVVVSPHAAQTGVYATAQGNLSEFGLPHITASARTSDTAVALAEAWGRPLLDGPVDHGVLLPIALAPEGSTFVCCAIAESATGAGAVGLGRELARSIHGLEWGRHVTFVASAHSAASLSQRAPLTERPEGADFDGELLRLLTSRPSTLAEVDSIPDELWSRGGSCSRGSLTALGEMARLCDVTGFEVISYEWPVGVGMLVARGVV